MLFALQAQVLELAWPSCVVNSRPFQGATNLSSVCKLHSTMEQNVWLAAHCWFLNNCLTLA